MELWEQIGALVLGLAMLFFMYPRIKPSMARSKNAEETHWGSVLLIAVVLIGFILLLVSSV